MLQMAPALNSIGVSVNKYTFVYIVPKALKNVFKCISIPVHNYISAVRDYLFGITLRVITLNLVSY